MVTAEQPNLRPPASEADRETETELPRTLLEHALAAHNAGLCVVPPKEDGSKAPLGEWKAYQERRPSEAQLRDWYGDGRRTGIGFITGRVSGNLECVEFDDDDAYHAFKQAANELGLGDLVERIERGYLERTPGGGVHWLWYCVAVSGNTKLAERPRREEEKRHEKDTVKTLSETRGEGGFVITNPSHGGVHPSGKPYELISGGIESIATVTPEEREDVFALARSFDEKPVKSLVVVEGHQSGPTGNRPGDVFNQTASWEDVLTPHGWTFVAKKLKDGHELDYVRRPGKDRGVSATLNVYGADLLKVFTSSTEFEAGRTYSKFAAYAVLNHDGDFKAASRALATQGYGSAASRNCTDLGNAERLVDRWGTDIRHCDRLGGWFYWDRQRWLLDETGFIMRLAGETARSIYGEAMAEEDEERRKKLAGWARQSESVGRLQAVATLARTMEAIAIPEWSFDRDPWLLNVGNGVLDLRAGTLQPHDRLDHIRKLAPVAYRPEADCPRWRQFLLEVFDGDEALVRYIQRAVGYSLTGETTEHVLFFLYGSGANGKSTFTEVLRELLGDYWQKAPTELLMTKPTGQSGPSSEVARLVGARFVVAAEVQEGRRFDEARLKDLTGGDTLTARFLYKELFEFVPTHKLWIYGNHKPVILGTDEGVWRRLHLIPFTVSFGQERRDPHLREKLRSELPGILHWSVEGCLAWQREGLNPPDSVLAATQEYRGEMDLFAQFIADRCEVDEQYVEPSSILYDAYRTWCEENGESPLRQAAFGQNLERRGFKRVRTSRVRIWRGLRLDERKAGARIISRRADITDDI